MSRFAQPGRHRTMHHHWDQRQPGEDLDSIWIESPPAGFYDGEAGSAQFFNYFQLLLNHALPLIVATILNLHKICGHTKWNERGLLDVKTLHKCFLATKPTKKKIQKKSLSAGGWLIGLMKRATMVALSAIIYCAVNGHLDCCENILWAMGFINRNSAG